MGEILPPNQPRPTVIVYQNADFVSGLLQELYQIGILETAETDFTSIAAESSGSSGKGRGSIGGVFSFLFGKSEMRAEGEYVQEQAKNDENAVENRKKFVYSQAFYMDRVRAALRGRRQVRVIDSVEEAESIKIGDFIEFDASFAANEANAILDILTPQLTAAITRYLRKMEGLKEIRRVSESLEDIGEAISVEKINSIKAIHEAEAENQAALAEAVTAAIRTDFRSDKTKEFYATIGEESKKFTAVTVCEAEHFVSSDSDRLLDGRFTVLAKVITEAREDAPILAKNKLLHRLKIEAVEDALSPLADDAEAQRYVNLDLAAKIEGVSITVLPIAIYI
ncbi:DUF6414 family protein [Corynebacterium faecale]|uniref:DUF6414 family protein n=1 Tax=Corynebacterium faecale TaxID=1758466 RepID=UPI0025B5C120|nr:hypothetical protein [Corynebacterium faecale]